LFSFADERSKITYSIDVSVICRSNQFIDELSNGELRNQLGARPFVKLRKSRSKLLLQWEVDRSIPFIRERELSELNISQFQHFRIFSGGEALNTQQAMNEHHKLGNEAGIIQNQVSEENEGRITNGP
jgi:hypothetical protein